MPNLLTRLLRLVAFGAFAFAAFGQTSAMLTLHVKTPDGRAVQDANVTIWPAHPVYFSFSSQNQVPPTIFATRTNAEGQARASKAELEKKYRSEEFVLNVRVTGYEPYKQAFKLADSKPLEIVLHPLPSEK